MKGSFPFECAWLSCADPSENFVLSKWKVKIERRIIFFCGKERKFQRQQVLKENADWTISNAITFLGKFLTNHLIFYRNHNQRYILRLKLLKAGKTSAHYRIYMKYNGQFLTESFQINQFKLREVDVSNSYFSP